MSRAKQNDNAVITSVLARCATDPAFLDAILTTPEKTLAAYDAGEKVIDELQHFDYTKVLQFAGFVTKVKNNNTWQHFPEVRALMKKTGIEHRFFTNYFPDFVRFRKENNPDKDEKIEHFRMHLRSYLAGNPDKDHQLILSVLDHQESLRKLRTDRVAQLFNKYEFPEFPKISVSDIIRLCPWAIFRKDKFNPVELMENLANPERLSAMRRGDFWLLYQLDKTGIRIYIEEDWVALILSLTNGLRTIKEIKETLERITGDDIEEKEFLIFYKELLKQGTVYLTA